MWRLGGDGRGGADEARARARHLFCGFRAQTFGTEALKMAGSGPPAYGLGQGANRAGRHRPGYT